MAEQCVFCRIVAGALPAELVYRDDRAVAFHDAHPQAPTHVLVVPVQHHPDLSTADPALLGHLLHLCVQLAQDLRLEGGHRIVVNTGADGGQTVGHLHLHLLGGRFMRWPPG
jgi:histidine triad (HIT) family protein